MKSINQNNQEEGKSLTELRDEKIDEMGKNLFHINEDMHLIFEVSRFREYIRALVLQILDEDGIEDDNGQKEYEISSIMWAKKYFTKIDSIFQREEDLARHVRNLRSRYEGVKRQVQKTKKQNWATQLLKVLIFKDTQQWLKSKKFRYKWLCELFDTTEISESSFEKVRKEYNYYNY